MFEKSQTTAFIKHFLSLGWPYILIVFLGYLLVEEVILLGGGEKDLLVIIPAMAFACFYTASYFILLRKVSLAKTVLFSAIISSFLLAIFVIFFPDFTGIQW